MKRDSILFSEYMVRAIFHGKINTRRVINPQPCPLKRRKGVWMTLNVPGFKASYASNDPKEWVVECPYGVPGDRLRVKESAWMWCERRPNGTTKTGHQKWLYVPLRSAPVHYCADNPERPVLDIVSPETGNTWGWRKKIGRFLPAWASRITLEIVSVRAELVQDITEKDAVAEGVFRFTGDSLQGWPEVECLDGRTFFYHADTCAARVEFNTLWDSINAERGFGWDENPWVWAIEFKRVESEAAA